MPKLAAILFLSSVLAGCATSGMPPAQAGAITLEDAMASVGAGLFAMERAEEGVITGLVPTEVTVTFNISASTTKSDKLFVEVGGGAAAVASAKAGGEASAKSEASRGNQITIKFSNLLYAGKDTLIESKPPAALAELLEMLYNHAVLREGTKPPEGIPRPSKEKKPPSGEKPVRDLTREPGK